MALHEPPRFLLSSFPLRPASRSPYSPQLSSNGLFRNSNVRTINRLGRRDRDDYKNHACEIMPERFSRTLACEGRLDQKEGLAYPLGGQNHVHPGREVPSDLRGGGHVDAAGEVRPGAGRGRVRVPNLDRSEEESHHQTQHRR